jgi:SAM-dependent methyltransferase
LQSAYGPRFYDRHREGSASSARVVLPHVREWIRPASVVDVGCGSGTWLAAWQDLGVDDVLGVDGAHVRDATPSALRPGQLRIADLTRPLGLDRTFDLAMSLEVAEHLPPECADDFVASLVRLAPVVLFSAAIPFQGGTGHLNEQWPVWWARRFAAHGYRCVDALRPLLWGDARVAPWYAQNILLYVRADWVAPNGFPDDGEDEDPASLVHPWTYLRRADPAKASLRKAFRVLGSALRNRMPFRRRRRP